MVFMVCVIRGNVFGLRCWILLFFIMNVLLLFRFVIIVEMDCFVFLNLRNRFRVLEVIECLFSCYVICCIFVLVSLIWFEVVFLVLDWCSDKLFLSVLFVNVLLILLRCKRVGVSCILVLVDWMVVFLVRMRLFVWRLIVILKFFRRGVLKKVIG